MVRTHQSLFFTILISISHFTESRILPEGNACLISPSTEMWREISPGPTSWEMLSSVSIQRYQLKTTAWISGLPAANPSLSVEHDPTFRLSRCWDLLSPNPDRFIWHQTDYRTTLLHFWRSNNFLIFSELRRQQARVCCDNSWCGTWHIPAVHAVWKQGLSVPPTRQLGYCCLSWGWVCSQLNRRELICAGCQRISWNPGFPCTQKEGSICPSKPLDEV